MTTTQAPPRPSADRPVRWKSALVLAALGPLGYGMLRLGMLHPDVVERGYSRGLYPQIQKALAAAVGWSPVQIGEALLLIGIGLCVVRPLRGLWGLVRGRRRFGNLLGHAFAQVLGTAGVLLFLFVLLWGLNHARLPLAGHLGLQPKPADTAALERVAGKLAERARAVRPGGAFVLPEDWRERVAAAYDAAGAQWPELAGPRPSIRVAWISRLMSWSSISGIYCPFTSEPNVDGEVPAVSLLAVACHETAHQRGFARENEADFLAWWVGSRSEDRAVAYSCELMAWRNVMWRLATNPAAWQRQMAAAAPELRADAKVIDDFWDHQPEIATKVLTPLATKTNDAYLKSSGHASGVRSYGEMVDLLIAALDR